MTKARAMMRSGRLTKTEDARKSGSCKKAKPRATTVCSRSRALTAAAGQASVSSRLVPTMTAARRSASRSSATGSRVSVAWICLDRPPLASLRLALDGGPCPPLALLGAPHAPAFGALGQLPQLAAPPVARPVGAAVPALQGREPLLHEGLRRPRTSQGPGSPTVPPL